jgi:ferredoxin
VAGRLTITPLGVTVPVAPGQSLLEAALAAGVKLPASCRNGTCRTCMARLVEGRVHYRVDWPGVLAEERAEGFTLPCVALPDGDVVLEQALATTSAASPARPASSG